MRREGHGVLPHVWPNQRVSSQQGPGLSVAQVGSGFTVHGQDEVADAQSPIAADGAPLDDAADQHPRTVLHGANRHSCEVIRTHQDFIKLQIINRKKKISRELLFFLKTLKNP